MICKYFRKKKHTHKPLPPEIIEDVILTPEDREDFKDLYTNEAGMQLIKFSEGYHTKLPNGNCKPYRDPVGIPTIGYGTIAYRDGKRVTMEDKPLTKEQATYELKCEVDVKENVIQEYLVKIGFDKDNELNENQFSALVSFSYNLGTGPIVQNGRTMNQALRHGSIHDIANAFLVYVKATKKFGPFRRKVTLPGLVTRRKAERALFLKPM